MSRFQWRFGALRLWCRKHSLLWALVKVVVVAGLAAAIIGIMR